MTHAVKCVLNLFDLLLGNRSRIVPYDLASEIFSKLSLGGGPVQRPKRESGAGHSSSKLTFKGRDGERAEADESE